MTIELSPDYYEQIMHNIDKINEYIVKLRGKYGDEFTDTLND